MSLLIAKLAPLAAAPVLFLGAAGAAVGSLIGSDGTTPTHNALTDIPADYLQLYLDASAQCPGLPWAITAAIGKVESDHGRSTLPGVHTGQNPAGAEGPMQFLPTTFDQYNRPIPPGGANPPSPYDPVDAIHATARMLCANGARDSHDIHAAIWNYNHSDTYVADVIRIADTYATASEPGTNTPTNKTVETAIAFAHSQLGLPYVWGGNGPEKGDDGFDCSGLTHAAYAKAGIQLPRTAQTQYQHGPHIPPGTPLQPGDLLFYGNPNSQIHHVGLYIGHGQMIHAPDLGQTIRISPYRWNGDDYAGATRPWN